MSEMIEGKLSAMEKRDMGLQLAIRGILENYFGKDKVENLYGYEITGIAFDVYEIVKLYIEHGGEK